MKLIASAREHRLIFATPQELEQILTQFEQSEVPGIYSREEAEAYQTQHAREAHRRIEDAQRTILGPLFLGHSVTQIARERIEEQNRVLRDATSEAANAIERAGRKYHARNVLATERANVLQEQIDCLQRQRTALTARRDSYRNPAIRRILTQDVDALDRQRERLQRLLDRARAVQQSPEEQERTREVRMADEDLRRFLISVLDIGASPEVRQHLASLDTAIMENATGRPQRLEEIIRYMDAHRQPLRIEARHVAFVRTLAALQRSRGGRGQSIEMYRQMLLRRNEINAMTGLQQRLEAMRTLPLGTTVEINQEVCHIVSRNPDSTVLILRDAQGRSVAIDTVPQPNTTNFLVMVRDGTNVKTGTLQIPPPVQNPNPDRVYLGAA